CTSGSVGGRGGNTPTYPARTSLTVALRAILDRRCARRRSDRGGRDGRMLRGGPNQRMGPRKPYLAVLVTHSCQRGGGRADGALMLSAGMAGRVPQHRYGPQRMRSPRRIRAPRRGRCGAAEGRTLTLSTALAGLPYRVRRQGLGGVRCQSSIGPYVAG